MYRPGESMRLEDLKRKGFNPSTILDIGAHSGQFYRWAKNVWPDAFIWMIEANECHADILSNLTNQNNDKYTIATMGDVEREVNLYTRTDKPHTEGASYYKESAYWDIPQLVMKIPKTLQTLDNLFTDDSSFDLIKMDTQGSEVDIIKGGKNLCKKSKYILLEVSLTKLNEGAPTYEETMSFMEEYGFEQTMSIGEHYDGDKIIQKDIIFKNINK
jgi:FkbM family methyltransferase|tara:strand:- start:559 stop:1203 length:645 start_codon:yes stop_codon:yes gene_type:complete